jgi:DNA (cytosine-5)-methyltransferase 3A
MNVLSLFDGISCARVGLDRAGVPVKTYYASEIDKHAIQISQKNYPDIVRLGDVRTIHTIDMQIDLLIGGSPCQDLSIAKKDRQGLEGNRSSLFWEYVRIKDLVKPRWFILENVASMPKKDKDIITKAMGVEPVLFNASLVSAQCRKRLFWTNIPFTLPEDRGIVLKDILQPDGEVDERFVVGNKQFQTTAQTGRNETKKLGYVGEHDHQAKRVYAEEGKAPALNVVCNSMVRKLTLLPKPKEHEFIQVGYFGSENACKVGGQALRVYTDEGKTTTSGIGLYQTETQIRKLTPIECERLQGLPDNYTEGVANTHRYKCLGNAFNVDVITHIIKILKTNS